MLSEALKQKPVDWAQVESILRSYPSWEDAVTEYANAHYQNHAFALDTFHRNNRGAYLRRGLVAVFVDGHRPASLCQAVALYQPNGPAPRAALSKYFAQNPETKIHKFKMKEAEALTEMGKEDLKPKIPAVPTTGSWWRTADGGFVINLQFSAKATDEQITHWFIKHMEEA